MTWQLDVVEIKGHYENSWRSIFIAGGYTIRILSPLLIALVKSLSVREEHQRCAAVIQRTTGKVISAGISSLCKFAQMQRRSGYLVQFVPEHSSGLGWGIAPRNEVSQGIPVL